MLILGAVVGGGLVAFLVPESVLWMRPALQPAFAVTMFFVGTLVLPEQLRAFAAAPLRVVTGVLAQYTIMPLSAAAIAWLFRDPVLRAGIVLVGCLPGAMASNVMTVLLGGDLVLSVSLTTLATLLSPLVLAGWLPVLADARVTLPVGPLVWNATWMVVIPVVVGIVVRNVHGRMPRHWDRVATSLAAAAIVLIVLVVVAANQRHLAAVGPALALGMVGLNLLGYALAFLAATLLSWPRKQRRTLVIEVGMQNAGLGSVLALAHLGEGGAVPSAFYTGLCVLTAAMALPLRRWLDRRDAQAPPPPPATRGEDRIPSCSQVDLPAGPPGPS